jgi:hypothetical protein
MKKIFTTFSALILFIGFLLLPIFVSAYTSMMNSHHGESTSPCLEHCLSSMDYSEGISLWNILGNMLEILVQKIFLHELILFVTPLASLYFLIYYWPPNLLRKIKNYNYSQLRGIVIATT